MSHRVTSVRSRSRLCTYGLIGALALWGCDDGGDGDAGGAGGVAGGSGGGVGGAGGMGGMLPEGCDHLLMPSGEGFDTEAVQTTFIEVEEGQTICMGAGTFRFDAEISISVDGVTLKGEGTDETILDFADQSLGANGVAITGDGIIVEHLQVQNAAGDGILAEGVSDITFRDLSVIWTEPASVENGAYGLYPVTCQGVTVERVLVVGASDAGIYVGQSSDILVTDSEAHGNVAGIEIENSVDAEVVNNYAHDNTAGILVFNLPNLPMQGGARSKVHNNRMVNNNLENFAKEGTVVANVPPGLGMLLLSADDNEIHDNEITGNISAGIVSVHYIDAIFGANTDPNFDLYGQGNYIHDNTYDANGTDPQGILADLPLPEGRVDVIWDGCSPEGAPEENPVDLCVSEAEATVFANLNFCDGVVIDTELGAMSCEGMTLDGRE